jgi:hypothetical protein
MLYSFRRGVQTGSVYVLIMAQRYPVQPRIRVNNSGSNEQEKNVPLTTGIDRGMKTTLIHHAIKLQDGPWRLGPAKGLPHVRNRRMREYL